MTAPKWFEYKFTIGNLMSLAVMLGGFIYGYATLGAAVSTSAEAVKVIPAMQRDVQESSDAVAALQAKVEALLPLAPRVSALETRSSIIGPARDKAQAEMTQALKDAAARDEEQNRKLVQLQIDVARILTILDPKARP